jgi:hypothetical protein
VIAIAEDNSSLDTMRPFERLPSRREKSRLPTVVLADHDRQRRTSKVDVDVKAMTPYAQGLNPHAHTRTETERADGRGRR